MDAIACEAHEVPGTRMASGSARRGVTRQASGIVMTATSVVAVVAVKNRGSSDGWKHSVLYIYSTVHAAKPATCRM